MINYDQLTESLLKINREYLKRVNGWWKLIIGTILRMGKGVNKAEVL